MSRQADLSHWPMRRMVMVLLLVAKGGIGIILVDKGLLRKANPLQRNWSQRSLGVKLATKRAIHDCCNC